MLNFRLKNLILSKFSGKIVLLHAHYFLCWKFAAVCQNFIRYFECLLENHNFLLCLLFMHES